MDRRGRGVVVAAPGAAQMLAWASTYYLPAILADPIAVSLHLSRSWIFGAFSGALLLSALLGPAAGHVIDRRGGRGVLVLSNLVFALGLVLLAVAQGEAGLALAWALLGIGMACGLYDAAFATLIALYGRDARRAITGVTLIAGFASTAGWPTTAFLPHASVGAAPASPGRRCSSPLGCRSISSCRVAPGRRSRAAAVWPNAS